MKNQTYIALTKKDFTLNSEVKSYFKERSIEIVKYYKNLNILKLEASYPLETKDIEYIYHIEKDKIFSKSNK